MITRLLQGMAKSLFLLASALAGLALLAGYCSYRLLRAAFAKEHGMPIRDATFMVMSALLIFANAVRDRMQKQLDADAARMASMNGKETDVTADIVAASEPDATEVVTDGD